MPNICSKYSETLGKYFKEQQRANNFLAEAFDLTGKSNPQYRRYSDWGKFLKNKFGGKEVIDPQGNSWMEIDLKKEMSKLPVEAFGVGALGVGMSQKQEDNKTANSTQEVLPKKPSLFGGRTISVKGDGEPLFLNSKDQELADKIGAHESKFVMEKGKYREPKNKDELYKAKHYNGALGYYGIERATLNTYEDDFFGKHIPTSDFLNSKSLQDSFARQLVARRRAQGMSEDEIIQSWNQGVGGVGNKKALNYLSLVKDTQ